MNHENLVSSSFGLSIRCRCIFSADSGNSAAGIKLFRFDSTEFELPKRSSPRKKTGNWNYRCMKTHVAGKETPKLWRQTAILFCGLEDVHRFRKILTNRFSNRSGNTTDRTSAIPERTSFAREIPRAILPMLAANLPSSQRNRLIRKML